MNVIPFHIRRKILEKAGALKSIGKPKIFCIGKNKTGTTSMKVAMKELGYVVGNQRKAELLIHHWANRDFKKIIQYCRSAEFFQDTPFGLPYTFMALDQAFKGSKFILTIRDNPEQWYDSLVAFHSKLFGKNGRIPTKEDLKNADYIYKGRLWEEIRYRGIMEDDPYNKEILIQEYNKHNDTVMDYFRHRPDDLLVLNVAEDGSFQKLCKFLGKTSGRTEFPWKNKTEDIKPA